MKRIICVGNRFAPGDTTGSLVYEHLLRAPLPRDLEVIDGGLGGLDLLRFVEGAERVVFVDSVSGFAERGQTIVLDLAEAQALAGDAYDHAAGLPYLLRALPCVCAGAIPEVLVVGVEGDAEPAVVGAAAELALRLACRSREHARQA